MSYNITRWITKVLDNLVIPLDSFFENPDYTWNPQNKDLLDPSDWICFEIGEDCHISGEIRGGYLYVDDIHASEAFSGHIAHDCLDPLLKNSTGTLVAIRIWEGGDSIDRLTVQNGVLEYEPIEL